MLSPSGHEPAKYRWYSSLAAKVLLGYLVLWAISVTFLSDTFLTLAGITAPTLEHFRPFKRWIFLLFTGSFLYWIVVKLSNSLLYKNTLLDLTQKKVARLNGMYRVLSEVNHVILRAHDRKQLLREICNIVKEKGNYAFVWIGLGETEAVLPQIIITSSDTSHYLQELFDGLQMASLEEKSEPALASFRKKYHTVVNDINNYTKKPIAWQKRAMENGYQSVAAFPLKTTDGLSGVFAIYASEPDVFSEEEITLLRESASDISYALSDIEQKEKLYYAANYDVITRLPNAELLEDRLNQTIARAYHTKRFVGLACIELSELNYLIGTYGQAAGDKVLQETGKHLSRLLRDGDTLARMGENRLGIMLADVADIYDIPIVIQKVTQPFLVQLTSHKEIMIRMRVGVSVYPKDGDNAVVLMRNAELALRGIVGDPALDYAYFSKDISAGMQYAKSIEFELEKAVERGEFSLYYQPIMEVKSRQLVGVEALMRWHSPKLGEVSPAQFIQVAKENQWMISLDSWAIQSACYQLKEWEKNDFRPVLSVNISSMFILHSEVIEKLKAIFSEVNFDPKEYNIAFEIPESLCNQSSGQVMERLKAIKEIGVKIYLDDFGTGHASLAYLHQLSIDMVKIDSILIRNSEKEKSAQTTLKGIMAFSEGLGVKTIAEGIETEKQFQLIEKLGCTWAQGYLFSASLCASEILKIKR